MATFTPNSNLYKWQTTDTKQTTITEMANNGDKLDAKLLDHDTKINNNTTALAEIALSVKSPQFGAKGDGVTDDTAAIQAAINYCVTNKKDLYFPAGTFITSSVLLITGYIRIYGEAKNTTIQCNGTNDNIITVQFSTPTTSDYSFSNIEIRDITINGNQSATVQNAICFNSVITLYNKLKNVQVNNVNGSAIRIINDGSRTNKSFYCHNAYWTGIYLHNVSEFLTQDTINSGTTPWIYGGEISDCHMEISSSFRSKPYLFDLKGFHNMNIKDIITEGSINTPFTSVYRCSDNAIFTNIYFEFILGSGVTVDSYFELGAGRYIIDNPVNLNKSCVKTVNVNTTVEVRGSIEVNIATMNHPSSIGKITYKNISFGSWYSGLSQDNVIPYSNQLISLTDIDTGDYKFSKNDYTEIYRLDKGAYISNFFGDSMASRWNPGTSPTMSIYEDPIYGRCLKFVPVAANNAVFSGVLLTFPSMYIGKKITLTARYKWQSTNLQMTASNLMGSGQDLLLDNNILANDTWRVSSKLATVDSNGNTYVFFDYDHGQSYTAPQNLYVSEIIVMLGGMVPTLPLKDDRPLVMHGTTAPTTGTFMIGDKVINTSQTSGAYEGWVCTVGGSPGTWQGYGIINFSNSDLTMKGNITHDVSGSKSVYINDTTNDGQTRFVNTSTGNYIQSGHMDGATVKDLYISGINGSLMTNLQVKANNSIFSGYITVGNVASLPTASSSYRGQVILVYGNGTSIADTFYICLQSATGTYSWKSIMVG